MNNINLDDYYSGGYFVIRSSLRPFWLAEPEGLVPETILSLESQFCDKLHLSWGWGSERRYKAIQFGIEESKYTEFQQWCSQYEANGIQVWSMFESVEFARKFIDRFIPDDKRDDLFIVGIGLHHSQFDDWSEEDDEETGVEKQILQKISLETGGDFLGFDVSSYQFNDFDHTWFSHGHHRGIFEEHGVPPGSYGLLENRDDAITARDYANNKEPLFGYDYWLLLSYPLKAET